MKTAACERWRAGRGHLMTQGRTKDDATKKAPKAAMPNHNRTHAL